MFSYISFLEAFLNNCVYLGVVLRLISDDSSTLLELQEYLPSDAGFTTTITNLHVKLQFNRCSEFISLSVYVHDASRLSN